MKICKVCKISLAKSNFYTSYEGKNSPVLRPEYKSCGKIKSNNWSKKTKVRGLTNCNRGLGYFKDDEILLINAIEYIK